MRLSTRLPDDNFHAPAIITNVEKQSFPEALESEGLTLRRYQPEDAGRLLQIVADNREQLVHEFTPLAILRTVADAHSYLAGEDEQWIGGRTFCYGIRLKRSDQLIGHLRVKNIAWEIPAAELGYFIGTEWQRQGYAGEAIRRVLRAAFEEMEFERIFLRILPTNEASLRLAKKLGFQKEGLLRNAYRCGRGDLHDVYYMSMIRQGYLPH
jgi:ribosomal-protein-serine acetyltransferase